jgi:hypothetical protein
LRAKEKTLWLAKLARSLHEATAAVWVAEKSDRLALKIARNGRNSATPFSQTRPEKVSCSILLAGFAIFLSEGHRSITVSTIRSGECYAITNR